MMKMRPGITEKFIIGNQNSSFCYPPALMRIFGHRALFVMTSSLAGITERRIVGSYNSILSYPRGLSAI